MNSRGRLYDLPHVVLLEVLSPVSLILVVLPAAEVLGVAVRWKSSLMWEPHPVIAGKCHNELLPPEDRPVQVVPGDAREGGGGELDEGAGVCPPDQLDSLNIAIK